MEGFVLYEDGSKFINSDEGYVALYKGKKITKEEYDKLCEESNVNEIRKTN
jgi:hypothetical protein